MTFVVYSDASFATKQDLSSQGGYMLAMCHKDVADGKCEGHYNVLDWRSWKLPRVARSTLSAESQAASEAANSLMYTSLFWNMIFRALLPLDSVETGHLANSPKLIVDAKALYDILVKEEIQAATGADKRTTIEALVCRDKLACCNGKVMWVSSELQYADGLTKDAAAQPNQDAQEHREEDQKHEVKHVITLRDVVLPRCPIATLLCLMGVDPVQEVVGKHGI